MDRKYEKMLLNYEKHCRLIERSSTIDINEKATDKTSRIKKLEKDYATWFEYHFPKYAKSKCSWYQKKIAFLLINFPSIYLLLEAFRSAGKTVHINMGIPLYLYLVKKDLRYMIIMGQTDAKAKRLLSGIQGQLKFNLRLINDYGNRFKFGDWADGDFSTIDDVRFRSFGFGQSPRGEMEEGQRPDFISVDDTDTKKHLRNETIMREMLEFVFEDLIGCFDASDTATRRFSFANNNFHKKCLTNRIKEKFKAEQIKAKAKGRISSYQIMSVPAVKDLVKFESNWPEKTSSTFWQNLYDELGHRAFCREYMNIHVEEGKIFKPENMQWKKMLPIAKYDSLCMYGDWSYKDQGDFKAQVLVGKSGKELHIISTFLRQSSKADAAAWIYDTWEAYRLYDTSVEVWIEGLFAMDEFISDVDYEGDSRGYYVPALPDERSKANKFDRIEGTQSYFQRRWVFFNEQEKEHVDQMTLLDQYYGFEKGSAEHDDGPDAMHGAISKLITSAISGNIDDIIMNARGTQFSKHRS